MLDYIYEVRGCNDPIDGDVVKFGSKLEALEYADTCCGDVTVYMVEIDVDDYTGLAEPTGEEMQIRGPEVDANLANQNIPNSCDGDNCANYDASGVYHEPELEFDRADLDVVDEIEGKEFAEELFSELYAKKELTEGAEYPEIRDGYYLYVSYNDGSDGTPNGLNDDMFVFAKDEDDAVEYFLQDWIGSPHDCYAQEVFETDYDSYHLTPEKFKNIPYVD